jgi:hypothetical protein
LRPPDLDVVRDSGVNVVKWTRGGMNVHFFETVEQIASVQRMLEVLHVGSDSHLHKLRGMRRIPSDFLGKLRIFLCASHDQSQG